MYLIDGREDDRIELSDRGLQYGDGVFETVAVHEGRPRFWERHLRRLSEGTRRLGIPTPDPDVLTREGYGLCAGQERAVLKVMVTRGSGGRGYRAPAEPNPRRAMSLHPYPDIDEQFRDGVSVRLCRTRVGCNPALAGIKHLNRLEQVLARSEWTEPDIAEGFMLDAAGHLVGGTMSNVFALRNGVFATPDVSNCGIAGIMRGWVMDTAQEEGIPCRETTLTLDDLRSADELFLTNALIGIWPVARFEQRVYPHRKLAERFAALLAAVDTDHD